MTRFDPGLHLPPDNVARDLSISRNPFFFRAPNPSPAIASSFSFSTNLLLAFFTCSHSARSWNSFFYGARSFDKFLSKKRAEDQKISHPYYSWSCVFWIIREYYWRVIFFFWTFFLRILQYFTNAILDENISSEIFI